jgi:chromosome segregation ATPase
MERSALQRDYNNQMNQLNTCQADIRSIEEQLEFVRQKKSQLGNLKGDIRENRQKAQKVDMSIQFTEWRGENYGNFNEAYVHDLCNTKYTTYIDEVDNNLDALINEERRLENKLQENQGLLGSIRQGLNWITSELEKITN